jgi:hypothetical protein
VEAKRFSREMDTPNLILVLIIMINSTWL